MKKSFAFNQKNNETCLCQCQCPNTLIYHMDCCCCPLLCCRHDYSPNIVPHSSSTLESPRIIIPKKEKEFSIKSEQRKKIAKLSENFKNKVPFLRNKNNYNLTFKSNTEKNDDNNDLDRDNYNMKEDNEKIKSFNNKECNILFKKIKVNKNNKERIFKIPNSIEDKKNIDINNYYPNKINRKGKGKNMNNINISKNKNKTLKILVNKKLLDYTKIPDYKKLNLTNINSNKDDSNMLFNSFSGNKLKINDKNDDIINIKQYHYTTEANDNRKILQNLKKEVDKAKDMIDNLKIENKNLKNKLDSKEQSKVNDNKSNNIEQNKEINMKFDSFYLKDDIQEIKNNLKEYENIISLLKKKNEEQKKIIEKQNKEIIDLIIKLENNEKSKVNKEYPEDKINIQIDEYKNKTINLSKEIFSLKKAIENKDSEIKELQIKLKYEKNMNNKKQKILEMLFDFYLKLKKITNFDKSKEALIDVIDFITIDDFQIKLDKVEKKIKQIFENMQIKYGHCFACDIACCTSHVDKLKSFRYKNPKNIK